MNGSISNGDDIGTLRFKVEADLANVDKQIQDIQKKFDAKPIKLKFQVDEANLRQITDRISNVIGRGAVGGGLAGSMIGSAAVAGQIASSASGQQYASATLAAAALSSVAGGPSGVAGPIGVLSAPGIICPHCGNVLPAGATWCPKCGQNIRSVMSRVAGAVGAGLYGVGAPVVAAGMVAPSVLRGGYRALKAAGRVAGGIHHALTNFGSHNDTTLDDVIEASDVGFFSVNDTLSHLNLSGYNGPSASDIGASVSSHFFANRYAMRAARQNRRGGSGGGPGYHISYGQAGEDELNAMRAELAAARGIGKFGMGRSTEGVAGSLRSISHIADDEAEMLREKGPTALEMYERYGSRQSGMTSLFGTFLGGVGTGLRFGSRGFRSLGRAFNQMGSLSAEQITTMGLSAEEAGQLAARRRNFALGTFATGAIALGTSVHNYYHSHDQADLMRGAMGTPAGEAADHALVASNYESYYHSSKTLGIPLQYYVNRAQVALGMMDDPEKAYRVSLEAQAADRRLPLTDALGTARRSASINSSIALSPFTGDPFDRAAMQVSAGSENRFNTLRATVNAFTSAGGSRMQAATMYAKGMMGIARQTNAELFAAGRTEEGRRRGVATFTDRTLSDAYSIELSNQGRYHEGEVESAYGSAQERVRGVRDDPNLAIEEKDRLIRTYNRLGQAELGAVQRRIDRAMHGGVAASPGNFIAFANDSARDRLPPEDLNAAAGVATKRQRQLAGDARDETSGIYSDRKRATDFNRANNDNHLWENMIELLTSIDRTMKNVLTAQ